VIHHPRALQIVYISAGGGWREDGQVISEINMAADYERMVNRDYTGRQVRAGKRRDGRRGTREPTVARAVWTFKRRAPHAAAFIFFLPI
jgi:hypothetical protein